MGMRTPLILAMVLGALAAPVALSAPSPAPTRDPAYFSYADYYMRHYADLKATQRPAEQDPYRFFNYYGYYQSRYGSGSPEVNPYYYYGLYEAALSERYRRALGTQAPSKPSLMNQALRFWQLRSPQPKRTPHER
ncbi:MAG TPA: hypothetical protein V6D05_06580 [Stenomitos sp.]